MYVKLLIMKLLYLFICTSISNFVSVKILFLKTISNETLSPLPPGKVHVFLGYESFS